MSDVVISAHGLGKRFRVGARQQGYHTIRESLMEAARAPLRMVRRLAGDAGDRRGPTEAFWALRDVSFEVRQGDVIGVIGRNGAGKSTLLKVLSRITEPTEGFVDITGRIGSLLEVGTGFHPELTGRENIFLNGAILGMGRTEIVRKFDQIVDFAEVERFIDTPVKHYSSGMYLRLAFAVAAHLEPEILLVDEVLAVGDVAFQRKCLGRMGEVSQEGRTVLFVSHNMAAVRSLCTRGLFLHEGRVADAGDLGPCIQRYYESIGAIPGSDAPGGTDRTGLGYVAVESLAGSRLTAVDHAQPFALHTTLRLREETAGFYVFCILEDMHGHQIFHVQTDSTELCRGPVRPGDYDVRLELPALWLNPGLYSLYFKAMLWGEHQTRLMSDKYPLDVVGESTTSKFPTVLHPRGLWMLDQSEFREPAAVPLEEACS
jgi:lipopolysaccharide transport system ATP-binding protein